MPAAEYLPAMKLMALRLDPAGGRSDREDILNLMQVTGMKKAYIGQFTRSEARLATSRGQAAGPLVGIRNRRAARQPSSALSIPCAPLPKARLCQCSSTGFIGAVTPRYEIAAPPADSTPSCARN